MYSPRALPDAAVSESQNYAVLEFFFTAAAAGTPHSLIAAQSAASQKVWAMSGDGTADMSAAVSQAIVRRSDFKAINGDLTSLALGLKTYMTNVPAAAAGAYTHAFAVGGVSPAAIIKAEMVISPGSAASPPSGTPAFGTARTYGLLAATAITNTGNTVITGNIGVSASGAAPTGFPPGIVSGSTDVNNAASAAAKASALATYTDLQARSSTVIASALDGQTLTAGVYSFASGAATLATSAAGVLTFSGSATDIFVVKTATTLTTGAGGVATIALSGGAKASNVYFVVGSSATINVTAGSLHQGNIIALTSITDTAGGTVNGSLVALNGAITLSAATTLAVQSLSVAGTNQSRTLVNQSAATVIHSISLNGSNQFFQDDGATAVVPGTNTLVIVGGQTPSGGSSSEDGCDSIVFGAISSPVAEDVPAAGDAFTLRLYVKA